MVEVKYLYIFIGVCVIISTYWFVDSIIRTKKYKLIEKALDAYVKIFGLHTFLFNDETGEVWIEGKDDKKQ